MRSLRYARKAGIKIGITVAVPPFLKVALDYTADLGEPANDNRRGHKPSHIA